MRDRYTGVSYVNLSEMCKYWDELEKLNKSFFVYIRALSFRVFILFRNKKMEESKLREMNFYMNHRKFFTMCVQNFCIVSDIKFNSLMLLSTAIKLYKENKIKKCFLFESAEKGFYKYYYGISNLQSDYFHYCSHEKFEGYEKRLGYREYCFVC